ncbi:MAG: response regulator [Ignavibacteriae bacterium]|nr:response regulator [Ignavibacteriota bacterium]
MKTPELSVPKTVTDGLTPEQYRVLIVDDERLVRWSLMKALQKANYLGTVAGTAEEALVQLRASTFDVMITDMRLPGIDGFALAAKAQESNPTCRVVMMTAFGDEASKERAKQMGIAYFIDKPINLADMVWMVQRILK